MFYVVNLERVLDSFKDLESGKQYLMYKMLKTWKEKNDYTIKQCFWLVMYPIGYKIEDNLCKININEVLKYKCVPLLSGIENNEYINCMEDLKLYIKQIEKVYERYKYDMCSNF